MAIRYRNGFKSARDRIKKTKAEALNIGANAHVIFSQLICPVDTGRLRDSIRQTQVATEEKPTAIVMAGGIVERDVPVLYAGFVEFGHATRNGGWVPANPFFKPGEDLGIQRIKEHGYRLKIDAPMQGW